MEILDCYFDPEEEELKISGIFKDVSGVYDRFNRLSMSILNCCEDIEDIFEKEISYFRNLHMVEDDLEFVDDLYSDISEELKNKYKLERTDNIYYFKKLSKGLTESTIFSEHKEIYGLCINVGTDGDIDRFFIDRGNNFILDENDKSTLVFKNCSEDALVDLIECGYEAVDETYLKFDSIPRKKYIEKNDYTFE